MVSEVMADSFPRCLEFTLSAEGGYVDNPHDPGGATYCGITLTSFREWQQNPTLSCADLQSLDANQIHDFYYTEFWLAVEATGLPLGVDLMVFDEAVNSGVGRSIKILQSVINATIDGTIGPLTLAAVLAVDPATLIDRLATAQTAYYQSLKEFDVFGNGWLNRVTARQTAAIQLMSVS